MPKNMIDFAIEVAAKAHQNQDRKHTDIPYITHPASVGMILQQYGYSDDLIIAGILHDAVEDTSIDIDYIKEHTIDHLRSASSDVKIVSCADKLHNIRAIAQDFDRIGDEVWDRFNRGKEKQEWYYPYSVWTSLSRDV
jgi:(p)ppGpp synthase/HD superfamily hydrolase